MNFALILAGGIGSRMGAELPKQFLHIHGRPIIAHTIDTFYNHPAIEQIIVLVPEGWRDYTEALIYKYFDNRDKIKVTKGGDMRNDTIMNGIAFIEENYGADSDCIIVTHDAVRPFITKDIIDRNLLAAAEYVACDTVIPATDTIVHSTNHKVIDAIPNRAELYQGQTPQTFNMEKFKMLYNTLTEDEKMVLTDAAKVFVIKGEEVALVEGDTLNIKVTYPSDLRLAESILSTKGENE